MAWVVRKSGLASARALANRFGANRLGPINAGSGGKAGADINIDLSDAIARAERAEAEVVRLTRHLAEKEKVIAEARIALRSARLVLRDHIRLRDLASEQQ